MNGLLSNGTKLQHTSLNFKYDIDDEKDLVNKQLRIDWYNKKRQIVLRLAEQPLKELDETISEANISVSKG